jgi:hypothetical protein
VAVSCCCAGCQVQANQLLLAILFGNSKQLVPRTVSPRSCRFQNTSDFLCNLPVSVSLGHPGTSTHGMENDPSRGGNPPAMLSAIGHGVEL